MSTEQFHTCQKCRGYKTDTNADLCPSCENETETRVDLATAPAVSSGKFQRSLAAMPPEERERLLAEMKANLAKMSLPRVACLCPTYGRPKLVQNALACFLAQDYPLERRQLLILDDAGQIANQSGDNWLVESTTARYPSLPAKYVRLVELAVGADILCVWDDDDVYLPSHVSNNVAAMQCTGRGWAHNREVLSDYSGQLKRESAAGRFHGSVVVSRALHDAIGGWVQTPRADFDQQFIARLQAQSPPAQYAADLTPQYIFRLTSTGHSHCQGLMSSPANTDWYDRVPVNDQTRVEILRPEFDASTKSYYDAVAAAGRF